LELHADVRLYHARSFPIPKAFALTTENEIHCLIDIGVLEANSDSEWATSHLHTTEKTGNVRVLNNFRKLINALYRTPFPLLRIANLLQKLESF
jgi:hypothetical protein